MASYSDDFNRADQALSLGGAWSEVAAGMSIFSNVVIGRFSSGAIGSSRYESALGSADHYSQVDVTQHGAGAGEYAGAAARFDGAAETYYVGWSRSAIAGQGAEIWRNNSGSFTFIARDGNDAVAAPFTLKLVTNGTALELFRNGVSKVSTTDANIAGNTKAGMVGTDVSSVKLDNWIASDLVVAAFVDLVGQACL